MFKQLSGMGKGNTTGKNAPTAVRVRLLRETLGYTTCNAFAAFLGISANRLNNVEVGFPLGKDLAIMMVQRVPGLTLDWLLPWPPRRAPD